MEASGLFHIPAALFQWNRLQYLLDRRLGKLTVLMRRREERILPLPRIEP
jgi:hypothetical protein